jgi:hypothetical protein
MRKKIYEINGIEFDDYELPLIAIVKYPHKTWKSVDYLIKYPPFDEWRKVDRKERAKYITTGGTPYGFVHESRALGGMLFEAMVDEVPYFFPEDHCFLGESEVIIPSEMTDLDKYVKEVI